MLALAIVVATPRAMAEKTELGNITEIVIEGNASIPREKILAKIVSREGREFNQVQIEADRKALERSNWFSSVRTGYEVDKKANGYKLIFEVVEMPVLSDVQWLGRKNIKQKDLEESTRIKVGARADSVACALAVNTVVSLYREKGYDQVEVRLIEGNKPGDTRAIFEIFEGEKCQVGGISFTGNSFVTDATLYTKISSRVKILGFGGKFNRDDVEEDARKLMQYYQDQGFFEVNVKPVVRHGSSVADHRVEFVIWEGPRYRVRNISFAGNKLVTNAKLRDGLVLHSGQPFSDSFKSADLKSLESKYGELGCIDAVIEPKIQYLETPGVVDLQYTIDEGQPYLMGRFIVRGNERTRDKVLRREAEMAGLVPGEPLNMARVELYKKRITNLRYFNGMQQQGAQAKPLEVKVANKRPPDQPYGETSIADENFVPKARLQNAAQETRLPDRAQRTHRLRVAGCWSRPPREAAWSRSAKDHFSRLRPIRCRQSPSRRRLRRWNRDRCCRALLVNAGRAHRRSARAKMSTSPTCLA
jgi:outer membrane protein insertion porin family